MVVVKEKLQVADHRLRLGVKLLKENQQKKTTPNS
jgi:hypothetical protein